MNNNFDILPLQELCQKLQTDLKKGLTDEQVRINYALGPKNILTEINVVSKWRNLLSKLFQGFSILLWIGTILCLGVYFSQVFFSTEPPPFDNLWLGCTMFLVIFLNAGFAYFQENKIENIMQSLRKLTPHSSTVVRNGNVLNLFAEQLVLGDLIILQAGDRIPADVRIINSENLIVNNSVLTGESNAQIRTYVSALEEQDYINSQNVAFLSTFAVEGSAEGIVIGLGDNTIVGQMGSQAIQVERTISPLASEVDNFIRIISYLAILCGIISAILTISMGYSWSDSVTFLVALSLANIPVGLVYFITIFLVIVSRKLSEMNCHVKSLNSVETLGSTTVFCMDKTGTLTQNRLTVSRMWCNNLNMNEEKDFSSNEGFNRIAHVAALCNNIVIKNDGRHGLGERIWNGDSTDEALLNFLDSHIVNISGIKSSYKKIYEHRFNSVIKYQAVLYQPNLTETLEVFKYLIVIKGAPETVIKQCSKILINNEEVELTHEWVDEIEYRVTEFASFGERVIAFCNVEFEAKSQLGAENLNNSDFMEDLLSSQGICFLGLITFQDPVRDGAKEFIYGCKKAGIKTVMITGDHDETARTVAKNVGIFSAYTETIKQISISGLEINDLLDQDLRKFLKEYDEIVFSRMSPSQKLSVVQAFQAEGEIVAFIGDGVTNVLLVKIIVI